MCGKQSFQDPAETPPPTRVETREERLERRRKEKAEQVAYKLEREIAIWDPTQLQEATEDPFKTLFVARIVSFRFYIGLKLQQCQLTWCNYDKILVFHF